MGLLGTQATSAPPTRNIRMDFGARESNLVYNFSNLVCGNFDYMPGSINI